MTRKEIEESDESDGQDPVFELKSSIDEDEEIDSEIYGSEDEQELEDSDIEQERQEDIEEEDVEEEDHHRYIKT